MAETTDIQENANKHAREAVIADCVSRVEARAMKSEMDFFMGVVTALRHFGMEEQAKLFNGRLFLSACGRSVCDPSWEEVKAKRAEGLSWDSKELAWVKDRFWEDE
tara:strand:- start:689 stop:1006 length:318 start_codon:yes stop_codon:yes gene_type:complete